MVECSILAPTGDAGGLGGLLLHWNGEWPILRPRRPVGLAYGRIGPDIRCQWINM